MTDEELITRLNNLFWLLEDEGYYTMGSTVKFAAVRIKTKAAEIEKLEAKLERGLSRAKGIEMACLGLRDEAQPMTAKEAARKMIAELTGDKP